VRPAAPIAAGLVVAAIAAFALLQPATPAAPAPASPTGDGARSTAATTDPARGSTVHRAAPAVTGQAPAAAPSRDLLLPDGTTMPTLNGATDAEPLATYWGPFPWSPIVGVERNDQGLDWYRHADGSYSTTQMVWRQDLGRMAAMTRVAHPGAAPARPAAR
jgi:hypothetical protein